MPDDKTLDRWLSEPAEKLLRAHGNGDWVDSLNTTVLQALERTDSEPVQTITGGLYGAIVEVEKDGQPMILKFLPPDRAAHQIVALEALDGDHCPTIYEINREKGWLLMEKLIGRPVDFDEPVDIEEAYRAVSTIWSHPLEKNDLMYRTMTASWFSPPEDAPDDLKEILRIAYELDRDRANEPQYHIHGDIGVHNLFQLASGSIAFVDPGGTLGPKAWDLGCLASWSGRPKREAVNVSIELANISGEDPKEISRWAITRTITSANLGYQRGNKIQYKECLEAVPFLLEQFNKL